MKASKIFLLGRVLSDSQGTTWYLPEFIAPILIRNCSKTSAGPAIYENEVDKIAWQFWHNIRPGVEILNEKICVNRLVSYETFIIRIYSSIFICHWS